MGKTFENILEKAINYAGLDSYSGFLNYLHNFIMTMRGSVKTLHPFTIDSVQESITGESSTLTA